jgi:hypothetical protein
LSVLGWLADAVPSSVAPIAVANAPWKQSNAQGLEPIVQIPGLGVGYKLKETTAGGAGGFHGVYTEAAFADGVTHTVVMLAKAGERSFFCFDNFDGAKDNAHNFNLGTPGLGKPYQNPLDAPYAKAVKSGWGLYAAQFKGMGVPNQNVGVFALVADNLAGHQGVDGNGFPIGRLGVWDTAFTTAELDAYVAKLAARLT